jgi:hypothetical protein
MCLK